MKTKQTLTRWTFPVLVALGILAFIIFTPFKKPRRQSQPVQPTIPTNAIEVPVLDSELKEATQEIKRLNK